VVDGLQKFLQLAELPASHRMAFSVGRVQALHGKQLRTDDTRQQQVPGDGGSAQVP
jgi:hypothetical protein